MTSVESNTISHRLAQITHVTNHPTKDIATTYVAIGSVCNDCSVELKQRQNSSAGVQGVPEKNTILTTTIAVPLCVLLILFTLLYLP